MKVKSFFLWLLLLVFTLVNIGCEKDQSSSSREQGKQPESSKVGQHAEKPIDVLAKTPIPVEEGVFEKAYGWLDEQTIIYVTNMQTSSKVYGYNLSNGSSTLIANSESPILSIDISDSGKYLLVRSSPSEFQSMITVLKADGSVLFTETLEAFDLNIEWNPYNEDKILISTFTEDWQDQSFVLSIGAGTLTEVELPNPFSNWLSSNELIFLDWVQEDPSLFAELMKKDLGSGQENEWLTNIYQYDAFTDVFMTITVDQDKKDEATYHFYQSDLKSMGSFTSPHLLRFSDWLVPYYDYNPRQKAFISLQPLHTGVEDSYKDGFQLLIYDLKRDDQILVMEGLENEPLSCSRDGSYCLYGHSLEKLIDLKNKKIMKLTTQNNGVLLPESSL